MKVQRLDRANRAAGRTLAVNAVIRLAKRVQRLTIHPRATAADVVVGLQPAITRCGKRGNVVRNQLIGRDNRPTADPAELVDSRPATDKGPRAQAAMSC